MGWEFLSGLALVSFTLGVIVYIVKELVGTRSGDRTSVREHFRAAVEKYSSTESSDVNDHLIGLTGKVISHSDDPERPMRVRISHEYWPARMGSTDDSTVSVGTPIRVTAVDGPILVIEASNS